MKSVVLSLFRAKRRIGISFCCLFAALICIIVLKPRQYEAHMSFLVRNERADPLISTKSDQAPLLHADISEEQINSEVELLTSNELLTQVVQECNLDADYKHHLWTTDKEAIAKAARKLAENLTVTPVRNASVIDVSYKSSNQTRSATVLQSLSVAYLKKHARVNSPSGALGFFDDQVADYDAKLKAAESQYADYVQTNNFTLLPDRKSLTLHRLVESEQSRDSVAASLAETNSRINNVKLQLSKIDPRITTQETSIANQYAVERLNTMLADLENRRTDLKLKFLPNDPTIKDIDDQIAQTDKRLKDSANLGAHDKSTNVNPLYQSLEADLATLDQTRAGFTSRIAELNSQVDDTNGLLRQFEIATPVFNELQRKLKEAEDNYILYSNKRDEARVSKSLDETNISNVVLEEPPTVPVLPMTSRLTLLTAFLLAALLSLVIGFLSEGLSSVVYTADDLDAEIGLPVIGSMPRQTA
jgi:uncharacterized protein involved in exopolysaccharide biosynthesis